MPPRLGGTTPSPWAFGITPAQAGAPLWQACTSLCSFPQLCMFWAHRNGAVVALCCGSLLTLILTLQWRVQHMKNLHPLLCVSSCIFSIPHGASWASPGSGSWSRSWEELPPEPTLPQDPHLSNPQCLLQGLVRPSLLSLIRVGTPWIRAISLPTTTAVIPAGVDCSEPETAPAPAPPQG